MLKIGMQPQGGSQCQHPLRVRAVDVQAIVHHGYLTSPQQHAPKQAKKLRVERFDLLEFCASQTCEKVFRQVKATKGE